VVFSGLLFVVAAVVAGCGGSDSSNSTIGAQKLVKGKKGGHVTVLADADFDSIDPTKTNMVWGLTLQGAINRTLYAYTPEKPDEMVPDIASGDPVVSADGKTVTIKIKEGIKFSKPVNRAVKSDDIAYAIERSFAANVGNTYSEAYFGNIVGAPKKQWKYPQRISGITTPDDRTIVFQLTQPSSAVMIAAMVMNITTPVPRSYAKKFDQKSPSTYGMNQVFTGPYRIDGNLQTGELTGYKPNNTVELVRNEQWDERTDFRPAYLETITIKEGNKSQAMAARQTLQSDNTLCCGDVTSLPGEVLEQAMARQKDQLAEVPGRVVRWIALNTQKPPFDNIWVRKAVVASFDRDALRRTLGGENVGKIAQHFIAPNIPGFEESGGDNGFASANFLKNPKGNPQLAKEFMMKAKKDGVPVTADGKYAGKETIQMVGLSAEPQSTMAQRAQAEFAKMGINAKLTTLPKEAMYGKCNTPANGIQICPSVGWVADFKDPQAMLQVPFDGTSIHPLGNNNWSMLNVPKINEAMAKATQIPVGEERNKAWADINRTITVDEIPAIPYLWERSILVRSKNLNGATNPLSQNWDLTFVSVK
jgi:peptide/nickel transport system substrate-binding protein